MPSKVICREEHVVHGMHATSVIPCWPVRCDARMSVLTAGRVSERPAREETRTLWHSLSVPCLGVRYIYIILEICISVKSQSLTASLRIQTSEATRKQRRFNQQRPNPLLHPRQRTPAVLHVCSSPCLEYGKPDLTSHGAPDQRQTDIALYLSLATLSLAEHITVSTRASTRGKGVRTQSWHAERGRSTD